MAGVINDHSYFVKSVTNKVSTMEDLCRRFPQLNRNILNCVDDKSLHNFRLVGRTNFHVLDQERFYWIRMIKRYNENFEKFREMWKKVITKNPVEFTKELATAVHNFFEHRSVFTFQTSDDGIVTFSKGQWHPLFIGALHGSVEICKLLLERSMKFQKISMDSLLYIWRSIEKNWKFVNF